MTGSAPLLPLLHKFIQGTGRCSQDGIKVLPRPNDANIDALERIIDEDLYQDRVESARDRLLEMAEKALQKVPGAVVCLACTELPLAFPEHRHAASFEMDGIRFVNPVAAHLDAVLDVALA